MDWAAPNLPTVKPNADNPYGPGLASSFEPKLQKELARLDTSVPFEPKKGYLHHTWAQTFFSKPEYFFQPKTISELQKIVTLARRCRKRLCITGFGHSPSDLTCTSSWLINLDNLDKIIEWNVDGTPGLVHFQAGITLHNFNVALAKKGYTLPNLGSIDVQSLAGSIATGTHGSSLKHGMLSGSVTSLTILLSNSQLVTCSATKNPELFRAALVSLGSLGVVVEMTYQAVPDFNISWKQTLVPLTQVLSTWDTDLWTQKEYTRVWWLPYLQRAVIWRASKTNEQPRPPKPSFYGGKFGYYLYHNLLAFSNYVPRILPWVEWFIFGMQYGFTPNSYSVDAVEPARQGLLMDCLYSQFVNEWALPLSKGPEAITRLSAWLNGRPESEHHLPFPNKSLYVHCPIEVRVTDTTYPEANKSGVRAYLDPTHSEGPTLYLNATLYRPYGRDPPCHLRYYEAFEYLMRELGGRPHWAKNFAYTSSSDIQEMYGEDMDKFMEVRDEVDPDGMFLGEWHARTLPLSKATATNMREKEIKRSMFGVGDAVLWEGTKALGDISGDSKLSEEEEGADRNGVVELKSSLVKADDNGRGATPSPPVTSTSDESFDYMAKGEASVWAEKRDGDDWKD